MKNLRFLTPKVAIYEMEHTQIELFFLNFYQFKAFWSLTMKKLDYCYKFSQVYYGGTLAL